MRFSLLLLAALGLGAAAGGAAAAPARRASACIEGSAAPSISPRPRPTQRAICAYEAAEFHRRLLLLLAAREGRLGIEAVERLFGLPRVTTAFDNVRSAHYSIILEGAPGPAPWTALISVEESFGPDIASRPARFRGSLRPVRLNPRERGDISISVALLGGGGPIVPGHPFCLTYARLAEQARRLGWGPEQSTVAQDSGSVTRSLERGGLELSYPEGECILRLDLDQPGNPPTIPITAAELAALRRGDR